MHLVPVDGGWSAWNVGYCSKTCGGTGMRTDWRTCNNPPPLNGGTYCEGPVSRTMPCYTCPCEFKMVAINFKNGCSMHYIPITHYNSLAIHSHLRWGQLVRMG